MENGLKPDPESLNGFHSPKLERLKDLMAYVAFRCAEDPTFGAVKLNKILYYSDFTAFRVLGTPITEATYFKLSEGPAPRELLRARDEMTRAGNAWIERRPYFNGVQQRLTVDGDPTLESSLSNDERHIIDSIVVYFWGKTAREVSDISHQQPGWIMAGEREDIPYDTAWLSPDPVDQFDMEVAESMAEGLYR